MARGYDEVGERYLEWSGLRPSEARRHFLDLAATRILPGARVLELGCGAGLPMTATLSAGRDVVGVDISPVQIERARRNVPAASFVASAICEPSRRRYVARRPPQ